MIDAQAYRRRIGVFRPHHSSYVPLGTTRRRSRSNRSVLNFASLTFLIIVGLAAACEIQDPGVESNPGPPPSFESKEEGNQYNAIRKLNVQIAKISSHRFYLSTCREIGIVPRGYKSTQPVATANPNPDLLEQHSDLRQKNSTDRMDIDVAHYNKELPTLRAQRAHLIKQLRESTREARSAHLIDILEAHLSDEITSNQSCKLKKLHRDITLLSSSQNGENWLPTLNLKRTEQGYITNDEQLCDSIINAASQLIMRENPLLHIQSASFSNAHLVYCPEETIHIHHNGRGHFVTSTSISNKVTIYDSLNSPPSRQLIDQLTSLYSPDPNITPHIEQAHIPHTQQGGVDCGLFAIAYAFDLATGTNPCDITYDQSLMRDHLLCCLESGQMHPFPRYRSENSPNRIVNVTRDIPATQKWSPPVTSPTYAKKHPPSPVHTSNRFTPLAPGKEKNQSATTKKRSNKNSTAPHKTSTTPLTNTSMSTPISSPSPTMTQMASPTTQTPPPAPTPTHKNTHVQTPTPTTTTSPSSSSPTTSDSSLPAVNNNNATPPHTNGSGTIHALRNRQQLPNNSKVINLSQRELSADEISVLELGLNFCPSVQHYNKEQLAEDCYNFIRRLKLREYFYKDEVTTPEDDISDEDRCELNWASKNPDWYPEEVIEGRSEGLVKFIDEFLKGTRKTLETNETTYWNNLTSKQRTAITNLAKDTTVVIKPSDKCGSVVVMDVKDYEEACLNTLTNKEHYEELSSDPNASYKDTVKSEVDNLKLNGLITDMEYNNLIKGSRTPFFYGLPKMHNPFDTFPSLRPISSGTDSCTARLSEFVDSFLKAAAQKIPSFIKDTTDLVQKIRAYRFPTDTDDVHLATMDVVSLYPNINQEEGAEACKEYMDKRSNQNIASSLIKNLILIILRCNTLVFKNRFFHQIKGTAMGTSMAVNFANLFMGKFESEMLQSYADQFGKRPALWLRYIDDVFIVWIGNAEDLKHFMNFCDHYASKHGYASTIRFKYSPPSKSVNFLDTTITLQPDGTLSTSLYSKPTAAHQYLHNKSYHVSHVTNSLPKSQFMRIRRICTFDHDFDHHSKQFVNFFVKRGYKESQVRKTREEVRRMNREDLLAPKPPATTERTPLVITYHHKFTGIGRVLRRAYQHMLAKHTDSAKVFPEPPLVAYRRTANIRDKIIRANHHQSTSTTRPTSSCRPSKSPIERNMNNTGTIVNNKGNRQCKVQGGSANTVGVIYAGRCRKHDVISVGQTGGPLNARFNGHRSDVKLRPYRTELDTHFHSNGCDFNKDLEVTILEQVTGSTSLREFKEDKWITRLNTIHPHGLNKLVREYGNVYKTLFA